MIKVKRVSDNDVHMECSRETWEDLRLILTRAYSIYDHIELFYSTGRERLAELITLCAITTTTEKSMKRPMIYSLAIILDSLIAAPNCIKTPAMTYRAKNDISK